MVARSVVNRTASGARRPDSTGNVNAALAAYTPAVLRAPRTVLGRTSGSWGHGEAARAFGHRHSSVVDGLLAGPMMADVKAGHELPVAAIDVPRVGVVGAWAAVS